MHALAHPLQLVHPAPRARTGEEVGERRALLRARRREQMDQHDGPLPLPDVAVDLLAVASPVAEQVEEVVLYLEGGAEEEAEAEEAVEVPVAARADERADAARPDGRVPARLLEDHLEVVRLGELGRVVPPPAELDRLALDRLARHALGLLEDAHGEPGAEPQAVVHEGAEPEERERVADVHGERDAMERVQRRATAPLVALVLDVVMDEEGVVEELERDRRAQCVLASRAEGARRRDAEGWPQHAPAAARVVGDEVVEMPAGLARLEVVAERGACEPPVLGEGRDDQVGRRRRAHTVPTRTL